MSVNIAAIIWLIAKKWAAVVTAGISIAAVIAKLAQTRFMRGPARVAKAIL